MMISQHLGRKVIDSSCIRKMHFLVQVASENLLSKSISG